MPWEKTADDFIFWQRNYISRKNELFEKFDYISRFGPNVVKCVLASVCSRWELRFRQMWAFLHSPKALRYSHDIFTDWIGLCQSDWIVIKMCSCTSKILKPVGWRKHHLWILPGACILLPSVMNWEKTADDLIFCQRNCISRKMSYLRNLNRYHVLVQICLNVDTHTEMRFWQMRALLLSPEDALCNHDIFTDWIGICPSDWIRTKIRSCTSKMLESVGWK